MLLLLVASSRYIFHSHKYLINPGDVLLHLSDVMLQDGHLDSFGAPEAFHDRAVLVPYVLLDHAFQRLDLVDAVVEPHDLSDQLRSLRHDARVDRPVDQVEARPEGLLHGRNTVELRVVRAHHCTVVADQLLTRVTEIAEGLVVQETLLFQNWVHLVSLRVRVLSTTEASIHTGVKGLRGHASELWGLVRVDGGGWRCWVLRSRWLGIFNFFTNLNALGTLGIIISLFRLGSYNFEYLKITYQSPSSWICQTSCQMPCRPSWECHPYPTSCPSPCWSTTSYLPSLYHNALLQELLLFLLFSDMLVLFL